ncbi:hypothetical protein PR202_gb24481 [Eleusine coracana subsp. coracana]|uniref:Uncharacterized protein n=1 Tax=Eleusine coracana subsp. coracana TaxID=191504 RepID=A0AAV5FIS6_ELECO|nr:hypothetical protein PR202_gb24481 [Eleusine coracana subsp. coracana]
MVAHVILRFLASSPGGSGGGGLSSAGDRAVSELNRQYGELRALLDAEKARQERAEEAARRERAARSPAMAWIDADLGAMGRDELAAFLNALEGVRDAVALSADQLLRDALLVGRRGRPGTTTQIDFGNAMFHQLQLPPGFVDPQGGFAHAILGPSF